VEALHARLLASDPLAPYALCGLLLRPLKQWVRRHVTDADDDIAEDGALEALRKYIGNPRLYDPRRGRLLDWLRKCAVNATRNLMKRPRRAREHEVAGFDLVAMAQVARPEDHEEANEARRLERRQQVRDILRDPIERAFGCPFGRPTDSGSSRDHRGRATHRS
jgi:DNA-directed RNA polymerase specialized sigma24 family protein